MENFFWNAEFYRDIEELIDKISDEEDLSDLEDDWSIECREGELQKVITLSPDWMMERISEERFEEDGDTYEKVYDMLEKNIDFEKIDTLMPELWYETRIKFIITKQDLLECL